MSSQPLLQPPSPPRTPSNHHHESCLGLHAPAKSVSEPPNNTTGTLHPPTPMSSPPQAPSPTPSAPASSPAPMARLHPHTQPTSAAPTVRCLVRTRIPTRFGADVYVHLYHNSLDNKEHLALVFGQRIRSRTLDLPHADAESDADRLTRGASVADPASASTGPRVHPRHASRPVTAVAAMGADNASVHEPPLVRLHSECFTGETISSVRCDCGDQLDEAMRLMSVEGNGVIVYLRQEGRGIGLLEKLRAYNLQDQGHDTVTANLLLNHPADLRTYDVASLILDDLGIHQVRLLTNNPDKMEQIAKVGIQVVDRVGMIPTHWTSTSTAAPRPHGLAHILSGKPHAVLVSSASASEYAHSDGRRNGRGRKALADRTIADETLSGFDSQNERAFTPWPGAHHHGACCHGGPTTHALDPAAADVDDDGSSFSDWEEGSSGSERPPLATHRSSSDARLHSACTSPASPPPGRSASAASRPSPLSAPVFPEMEAYLRTKVERMRHIIDLSASPVAGMSASSLLASASDAEAEVEDHTQVEPQSTAMADNGEVVGVAVVGAADKETLKVVSPRPVAAALAGSSSGPTPIAFSSVGVTYGG